MPPVLKEVGPSEAVASLWKRARKFTNGKKSYIYRQQIQPWLR
jgi:hypothetical protein